MPRVSFEGRTIECEAGQRLRTVLLQAGLSPHNGRARLANCRGLGTCGTCAVKVEGAADAMSPPTKVETWRLGFPPHRPERGLRLACQLRVHGDLRVSKGSGFWGQHIESPREPVGAGHADRRSPRRDSKRSESTKPRPGSLHGQT